jgi:hypothetical protein
MDLTGMGAMVLNWFFESEEVYMLQMVSPLILKLSLFLVTAVATHLVMSFGQTFLHYKVAHNPIGGKLFRNHINFHHTHYAEDHLVSRTYLGDEGNITPYFLIPVFLVGGCVYFLLPLSSVRLKLEWIQLTMKCLVVWEWLYAGNSLFQW